MCRFGAAAECGYGECVRCGLVQQALERSCVHWRRRLRRALYAVPPLPHIPAADQLKELVPRYSCLCFLSVYDSSPGCWFVSTEKFNWAAPAESFPRLTRAILLPPYCSAAVAGIVISVGGLTESLVRRFHL